MPLDPGSAGRERGARRLLLVCHPQTPCRLVRRIEVSAQTVGGGALALGFSLHGEIARLRIAQACAPKRVDGLWRHTCFEAFVATAGEAAYREFNFAPSGEWAAYAFRGYRDSTGQAAELPAPLEVRRSPSCLQLDALLACDCLPPREPGARLRLGLSAVVEDEQGTLSYWALAHSSERPDFHHPSAFALELEPVHASGADAPAR